MSSNHKSTAGLCPLAVIRGFAAGFLGGLAGTCAMGALSAVSQKHEAQTPSGTREQNEPATVKAAEAVSERVFHHRLTDGQKPLAGNVAHYAMGAISGGLYGAMAEIAPMVSDGAGIVFGIGLWLFADELAVPAMHLAKPPTEYPGSTHADALASHILYGAVTDCVRRVMR